MRSAWLVCVCALSARVCVQSAPDASDQQQHPDHQPTATGGGACVSCDDQDLLSFQAICSIHKMMDDDADGTVDTMETDGFLREDLHSRDPQAKQSSFHRVDLHISLDDMWSTWTHCTVYNWTVEQVADWLVNHVEMPQYTDSFRQHSMDGRALPRLAVKNTSLTFSVLRIADRAHARKLQLKALDTVLFGPPPDRHNHWKDLMLACSVAMALAGCWFAYVQTRRARQHLGQVMKDLEGLQRAEQNLLELQDQLRWAQEQHRSVQGEKVCLELRLRGEISQQEAQQEAQRLKKLHGEDKQDAQEELSQVRGALRRAERELQALQAGWTPPGALQAWLQLTHEVEERYYSCKRQNAERQLVQAREGAEKMKKKRGSLWGTFQVAHSSSLDDVDHHILTAKQALGEVTVALKEKLHRWQHIEALTGFSLLNNPGLWALGSTLNLDPSFLGLRPPGHPHLLLSDDLDDLDEDLLSPGTMQYAAWQMDRRVSDLWPLGGVSDSQYPWKQYAAPSPMPLRQRVGDHTMTNSFQRDVMNRSDSDSSLQMFPSESQRSLGSRAHLLPSKPLHQQGHAPAGPRPLASCGPLEKSSSLGELRGSGGGAALCSSTRSLCPSSPEEHSAPQWEETNSVGSRRKHAFPKLFKKRK